mmetsp:Transcript_15681/g.28155  ORF Transcript_15681/g.28155 Transcript_15681/m.28155 type:complete len:1049 (+) Transcript_15681:70-3216(+)
MEPPDAPDGNLYDDGAVEEELHDGDNGVRGSVELKPLVSSAPRDGPVDPDGEDGLRPVVTPRSHRTAAAVARKNVAFAKPTETSPVEHVASMLSNEGVIDAMNRLQLAVRGAFARRELAVDSASSNNGIPLPSPTASNDNAESVVDSTKRKKMLLLLMATLFVALMGAVLEKSSAVSIEGEIEEGKTEEAFHVHSHMGHTDQELKIHQINVTGYQVHTLVNPSDYILPGTEDAPPLSAAKGRPYTPILNHFQNRCPTCDYAKQWGYFDFQDPDPKWDGKMRPQPDFTAYPNRDVPNSEFPEDAWQRSDEYMQAFLAEAKLLVNRSIEGVYAEYGVGFSQDGSITMTEEQMENRLKFFSLEVKEDVKQRAGGSWTTKQSMERTARRFIHHIMTGDTFKLVLGGHSAAAGHGAGFNQSYIIEAGHVLEPVFAHLGVESRAYNFAQGGMGTFQQALAGADLRSKEADWVMWDSRMTERPNTIINFFLRQAIVSGNRAPVLMSEGGSELASFHDIAGASVAAQDKGWLPFTVSEEQVKEVPWAAQYMQCGRGATVNCKGHEYTAGCWVEREDFKPEVAQNAIVGGGASWHPGNRIHKHRGRMIALIVLKTLDYALDKWVELAAKGGGYPIAEEHWHVTDYYKNIQEKVKEVPGCYGDIWKIGSGRRRNLEDDDFWPSRLCNIPLQGRTLWGPRHNPMETSLLSIMKPNIMGDIDPKIKTNAYLEAPCYQPPDRPGPWVVPPMPEPYAPLIGWNRRLTVEEEEHRQRQLRSRADGGTPPGKATEIAPVSEGGREVPLFRRGVNSTTRGLTEGDVAKESAKEKIIDNDTITPGLGINVHWGRPGVCDGSSHSWCDKKCASSCLLAGSQDNRGMVCFDGLSGWLVLDVKNVKYGFIGARMEAWRGANDVPITSGWTEVNNGGRGNYDKRGRERELHVEEQRRMEMEAMERMNDEIEEGIQFFGEDGDRTNTTRRLGGGQSCGVGGDYTFQYAINGEIMGTWNQAEFCKHYTRLSYNLDVIKFMDDVDKTGDFELAMRITNGGRGKVMCITHLYWA